MSQLPDYPALGCLLPATDPLLQAVCTTIHVHGLELMGMHAVYLDARSLQGLGKLCCIMQRCAGVPGAMQQQHWRHEVRIAGPVHHVGGGKCLQLSLALEVHDAVEQSVV